MTFQFYYDYQVLISVHTALFRARTTVVPLIPVPLIPKHVMTIIP